MQLKQEIVERPPVAPTPTPTPTRDGSVGKGKPLPLGALAHPRTARAVRRILVCIDHSSFARACVRHAIAISKSLGGTITVLHVMQPPHERAGTHATDVLDWEIERQAELALLGELEREATKAAGHHVETRLEQGHPAQRIVAVARELDAGVTILGSRGERGDAPWDLGSTVLQVLAVAQGSVLVVRSTTAAETDIVCPKRILVPLDGSVRAESVLPSTLRIASMHGAELLLALVIQEPIVTRVLCSPEDLSAARDLATRLEISGKRYLEELRGQLSREGASVRTLVLRSPDERQCLLELSRNEQSDLIVLSAHGSNCNPAVISGSVTVSLLAHAAVPLLVLQDLHEAELRGPEGGHRAPPLRASCPPVDG